MGTWAFTEKGIPPSFLHRIKGKDILSESRQIITNYEFHISSSGGWRALQMPPIQQCAVMVILKKFFTRIQQIPEINYITTPIGLCLCETGSSMGAQHIFLLSACTSPSTTGLSMTYPICQSNERKAI